MASNDVNQHLLRSRRITNDSLRHPAHGTILLFLMSRKATRFKLLYAIAQAKTACGRTLFPASSRAKSADYSGTLRLDRTLTDLKSVNISRPAGMGNNNPLRDSVMLSKVFDNFYYHVPGRPSPHLHESAKLPCPVQQREKARVRFAGLRPAKPQEYRKSCGGEADDLFSLSVR
jgi:hypothetical protein